jgi:hypothetical protein
MEKKKIYLELSEEIIYDKNPENRKLSDDEIRVLNYINSLRALNRQDLKLQEREFFITLHNLYKESNIPLLTVETSNLLYKKFNRNKDYISCMLFVSKKLKNKSYIQEKFFWEMFISSFSLMHIPNHKTVQLVLNVFVKFAKLFFNQNNYKEYKQSFNYILNVERYPTTLSKSINAEVEARFEILNLLKKNNAETEVIQHCFFLFSNGHKLLIEMQNGFIEFIQFFIETFPIKFLMDIKLFGFHKLNYIFKLNKSLFLDFNFDSIIENHLPNGKTYLCEDIIYAVLSKYGISFFFIQNFNKYVLPDKELNWFNDVVSGKNLVYSECLPFKITKKLAHKFNTVNTDWKM